ncbi:MAG: HAD hydrolase-like protein, partial [Tannerella sp.]|nr:HAD hydrolase-like protein [Tannerella sp.]
YFPGIKFTAVFGQRENIPVKPDPAIVHEILRIADIPATETVYVGDSGVDMQTAAHSGLRSIGVTWGFRPRSELETFGATHIVDSTKEIFHLLSSSQL